MRVPRPQTHGSLEFNMTPMIDVTMLLIVFFLLASHLTRQEQQALNVPSATTSRSEDVPNERRLVINVLPSGELQLAGQPVAVSEFKTKLIAERQTSGDALEVLIRSDQHVRFDVVEPLLVACAKAGVWKVNFAVTRKVGPRSGSKL